MHETTPEPNTPQVAEGAVPRVPILTPRGSIRFFKPYNECTKQELAAATRLYSGKFVKARRKKKK